MSPPWREGVAKCEPAHVQSTGVLAVSSALRDCLTRWVRKTIATACLGVIALSGCESPAPSGDYGPTNEALETVCSVGPAWYGANPGAQAIVTNVEVRCDDPAFSLLGFDVAPTPAGAVLVASGARGAHLIAATGDTGEAIDSLPAWTGGQAIALDQDALGHVHLAARHRTEQPAEAGDPRSEPRIHDQVVYLYPDGDRPLHVWNHEVVREADEALSVHGFAVDPNGAANLWIEGSDLLHQEHLRRRQPGSWAIASLVTPGGTDSWPRALAFAGDGSMLTVAEHSDEGASMRVDDTYEIWLPTNAAGDRTPTTWLTGGARPGFAALSPPAYLLANIGGAYDLWALELTDHDDWPVDIEWTGLFVDKAWFHCDPGLPPYCAPACTESSTGVRSSQVAVARTNDGRPWVVWIESQLDIRYAYDVRCTGSTCGCETFLLDDRSTAKLRISTSGENFERVDVLELPVEVPLDYGADGTSAVLVARGFGDRIAIAIRVRSSETFDDLEPTLQLLEFDTSRL